MLLTQRPPAIVPLPTLMHGPTTMQYIYPSSYTHSPLAVVTAINASIYRNKLNKRYSLNVATITTLQTPPSTALQNTEHQTEQRIAQTYSLMTSLRAEGVPRKLALITLAWAQLLAGTQQPVLSNVMTALPHLNPMKWLPLIRAFLCTIGSQIEVENLPATPLQRKHDQFLMDIALDLYSKLTDLQHLNACRLHLQVTLLSDITTADSTFIRSEIMQSHRALSNSAEELFPYQPSPDTAGWNIWQAFLLHLTRAPAYSLIQPLGRWLHHSHALLRK